MLIVVSKLVLADLFVTRIHTWYKQKRASKAGPKSRIQLAYASFPVKLN
ncbi:hypothetical protein N476_19395 [Pseudoalteromonas luteoviolacea H33]|uniref:Uncharacterized protein n=1 Tax=Pseudoalteromonas luteoviolacea H33 TaxID=1365251 RepID=A0A167DW78_9GAMM|nr:hypothetical protein N476_19395 [Pseudoalteromonas luteoviolacea H33]KZN72616.1 hypothetical protein N477_24785 [Pseudoalteromonas luteoviolacea H33-S]